MLNEAEDDDKPVPDKHARWVQEIQLYETEFQEWEERGKKILKRYKDKRTVRETNDGARKYNILYSNIQTLLPAYFSTAPKPDIERRFKDKDDVGRIAAEVWERSTAYFTAQPRFYNVLKQAVTDRLLPGRGTIWVRYVPYMNSVEHKGEVPDSDDGAQLTDDVESVIYSEEALADYVYWEDFGHTVARTWEEVRAVWRKVYLTRSEGVERFGEVFNQVPLDYTPKGLSDEKIHDDMRKAVIYEIWDKDARCAYWLHKSYPDLLDEIEDPLQLEGFFPCPKPLYPLLVNDSLVPIPDYAQYQDQAKELDDLTARIAAITKAIKVAGVYDASVQGLERLLAEGAENKLIPVEQWAVLGEKGGLSGVMDLLPVQDIVKTLLALYDARERVKSDLYEITGISDIVRGASKATETATAQQIKGQYASLRLDEGQQGVQRFARDVVKIIAEIIVKHFQPETIKQISGIHLLTEQEKQLVQQQMAMAQQAGQPLPPMPEDMEEMLYNPTWEQVFALLKDNATRCFRIDIETNSTLKADQENEKKSRNEFLTAAGQFISQAATVGKEAPELAPLLMEMLMFGVRGYSVGKQLESTFQITMNKMQKAAEAQKNAPPPPDPEMQKAQMQAQMEQARMQADQQKFVSQQQIQQQIAERENALKVQQAQADVAIESAKLEFEKQKVQLEMANERFKIESEIALEREKIAAEIQMKKEIEMMKLAIQTQQPEASDVLAPMREMIMAMQAPKKITLDNGREATVTVE